MSLLIGHYLLIALSVLILVPSLVLCLETLWSFLPGRPKSTNNTAPFIVLVPSHDEALHIGATVDHLRSEVTDSDRLIVIADNCSDATAEIAIAHGAEVFIRHDLTARGKSHALAFALQKIADDPREIVIIIDADCRVSTGGLRQLAAQVERTGAPAQAMYLFQKGERGGNTQALSAFSLHFRNQIRPLGQSQVGLPCQLLGSGMAFRREALDAVAVNNLALGRRHPTRHRPRAGGPRPLLLRIVGGNHTGSTKGSKSRRPTHALGTWLPDVDADPDSPINGRLRAVKEHDSPVGRVGHERAAIGFLAVVLGWNPNGRHIMVVRHSPGAALDADRHCGSLLWIRVGLGLVGLLPRDGSVASPDRHPGLCGP